MAKEAPPVEPPDSSVGVTKEHWEIEKEWFKTLWARHEQVLARIARDGFEHFDAMDITGLMLSWPRADGRAYYLVVRSKPLTVAQVLFADCWSVEPALIKGLDLTDVQSMVASEIILERAMGRLP